MKQNVIVIVIVIADGRRPELIRMIKSDQQKKNSNWNVRLRSRPFHFCFSWESKSERSSIDGWTNGPVVAQAGQLSGWSMRLNEPNER